MSRLRMTNSTAAHAAKELGKAIVDGMNQARARREEAPQPPRSITTLSQLGSVWQSEDNIAWLVPNLIAEGSVNLISAKSGVGKSWIAYWLGGAVARGEGILGRDVVQRPTLYLDGENPRFVVKDKLRGLNIPDTPAFKIWGTWESDRPPNPDDQIVVDFAQREKPLLIWDSLVEFHTGDEQSSTETRQFMRKFRTLASLGATVIILHHTGKATTAQDYRGSSDIEAAVDMAFKIEWQDPTVSELRDVTLRSFKSRFAPHQRLGLRFRFGEGFMPCGVPADAQAEVDPLALVKQFVEAEPGMNQTRIVAMAKAVGVSKHKAEEALTAGCFRTERRREGKLYFLKEEPVENGQPDQPSEPLGAPVPAEAA